MIRRLSRWFAVFATAALVALMGVAPAVAGQISLSGDEDAIPLNEFAEYFEDTSATLGIEEVANGRSAAFAPMRDEHLNRGFSLSAHWLRFSITNRTGLPLVRWVEIGHARLQNVSLFERVQDGWKESRAGTQVSMNKRAVKAATAVLPLTIPAEETGTWYVRIVSETAVELNGGLWDPIAFRTTEARATLGDGLILGAVTLGGLSALVLFGLIREPQYLWFGLFQLFFAIHRAGYNGLLQLHLWPEAARFPSWAILLLNSATMLCLITFVRHFLNLDETFPRFTKMIKSLGVSFVVLALTTFVRYRLFTQITLALMAATLILIVLLSVVALFKGHKPARWLFLGMLSIWSAAMLYLLTLFGIASSSPAILTDLSLVVALLSALTLFAVTDKVRQAQAEKQSADTRAIARLEEAVRERTRDLEAALLDADTANQAKTAFLARVSHELRTPLHTVIGYAQLIRRGSSRIPPAEGATAIEHGARRLLRLIDELLDFVRGESGRLRLQPEPVRWSEVMGRIVGEAAHMAQAAGNRFAFNTTGEFPVAIAVDEPRLRQVFDNLFANANRHTRDGDITLHATVTVNVDDWVCLEFAVTDTGSGIPPPLTKKLFEPLTSGAQGMGLGLAISSQLVTLMGGRLRLDKTSLDGSRFVFDILCPTVPNADIPPATEMTQYRSYLGPRRTILVVEDIEENRRFIEDLLRDVGFQVISAGSGQEGIRQWNEDIHLVITDQFMPDGDGWMLLEEIRQRSPEMPVLLVSAAPSERPAEADANTGFSAFLLKPVDSYVLLGTIGELLDLSWTVGDEPATTPRHPTSPLQAPVLSKAEREALRRMIDLGQVTSLQEWADTLAQDSPTLTDLAHRITQAAERLDFQELQRIAEWTDDVSA